MTAVKRINLALQGGGAHGAFTWGVLDRILQDERIEIAAISGTSAGAMNAAALKSGWISGGRDGARQNLDWLWGQLGAVRDTPMTQWLLGFAPPSAAISRTLEQSWAYAWADMLGRVTSPYAMGPFYQNPLRPVAEQLHYDQVCAADGPQLFVGATNVRTGKIRVFAGDEITADALLASACLPSLFQAVEIEDKKTGETHAYWDGGYSGNPALFPLFAPDLPDDIVIVNINPLERAELPRSPVEIQNRINEISFNSSLLRELRAIGFVKRLLSSGGLKPGSMKDVLVHMIADDALMNDLSLATKLSPGPVLLDRLKTAGQGAADRFLEEHFEDLNVNATVNVEHLYQ